MNRNTLLKVNSVASVAYQVIALLCGFILPRLIIGYYGSAVNGLLSSITNFLGVIALCELGMGAVVPASLYKPLADRDQDEISRVFTSAERFYRKIAWLMVAYVIGLTLVYPFLVENYSFFYTASLIVIIASSTFAQYFFGITNSLLITADQKQYITYIVNGSTLILNLIITYMLIRMDCPIHIVKLFSSLVFIIRPVLFSAYVARNYHIDRTIRIEGEPIRQKWNGIAQHLAYTVQEKIGVIILSILSTLEYVSVFSIYLLIVEGLRGVVYSVTSSLTSFLGNILAKDEREVLTREFMRIEWSIHTVSVLFYSVAALLIVPFVKVYTAGITDVDYIVPYFPVLMCMAIGFRCLQMPYNIVVQAAGHFKETQNSAIVEPVINILVSVSLVGKWGLNGVALGMMVSMFYRMMYLSLYLTKNIIGLSGKQLLKRYVVDVILAVSIVYSCSFFTAEPASYGAWFLLAVKIFLTASLVALVVNLVFYKDMTVGFIKRGLRYA